MKKCRVLKIFLFIIALGLLCMLYACDKPANYVEVETLRIESANVFLSPSGETAKKQLEVEILPANATNRKLIYYIPSAYLKYATVSETGLLTALLTTEEDMTVPLTITSSTNKKATLQVNVVVEYTAVREVNFTDSVVELLYKGTGHQLAVTYTPYHAQDGRAVTFSSLNPDVATVTNTGLVEPVMQGSTRIIATCRTATGKSVEGRIQVYVNFVKGRYRLEVSDTPPQYNQILGDFKQINFNLMILEEKSDPKPRIQWYVDSQRVIGMDSYTQYQHTPTVSTKTSYRVSVKITPYNEPEQELFSELITVFNIFRGFDLNIQNITATPKGYQYGDEVTFPLTISAGNVSYYDWYLKKRETQGAGVYVGRTLADNKDLVRRLNLEGDFTLTAEAKDSYGSPVAVPQKFDFSVTRFNTGDTLIVRPDLVEDGMPPESYNWYRYDLDEAGNRLGGSTYIGNSVQGKDFCYSLTSNGRIEIVALAMLDGVVAKVENEEFEGSSGIVRIFGTSADSQYSQDIITSDNYDYHYTVASKPKINNIVIEGVNKFNENLVNIHWAVTGKYPSYVVEIIKEDGKIYLLDSATDTTMFGDYYIHVAKEIVTLNDKFSVRVKQKGGMFSERYYYGYDNENGESEYYFDKIANADYLYLSNIHENINGYVLSMGELGNIIDYIMLFLPRNNSFVKYSWREEGEQGSTIGYDAFTVNLRILFDYQEISEKYPVAIKEGEGPKDEQLLGIYKMLLGVQKSYCETGEYKLSLDKKDNGYDITIMKKNADTALDSTDIIDFVKGNSVYYSTNPYGSTYSDFAIGSDTLRDISVTTTDQLYAMAELGKSPIPGSDGVGTVFTVAKNIVRKYIGVDMNDRQKVLAFFDYLTTNVVYDTNIISLIEEGGITYAELYKYDSFHLEGVFNNNKAVCDGIAKAMSLLCAIEGIPCIKVAGTVNGVGHSWNRVLIDGEFYNIDATYGIKKDINNLQYANHKYFLMTDAQMQSMYTNLIVFGEYVPADVAYDFYAETKVNGLTITVSNQDELKALLDSFGSGPLTKKVYLEIKISDNYLEVAGNSIEKIMTGLVLSGVKEIEEYILLGENRIIVVMG